MTSDPWLRLRHAVAAMAIGAVASLPAAAVEAAVHEVAIISFAFEPAVLEIDTGDTVRWTVRSGRHSATADGDEWDSGVMPAGATFERRFDTPGTFAFHCTPHSFMRGTVVVRQAPTVDPSLIVAALAILALAAAAVAARRLARPRQR